MPVLAEQAVESAAVVKDSQIAVPILRTVDVRILGIPRSGAARADPVGDAVGGEGIMIPGTIAPFLPSLHLPAHCLPGAAESGFTLGEGTGVEALGTGRTGNGTRGLGGEMVRHPRFGMGLPDKGKGFFRPVPKAVGTRGENPGKKRTA